MTSIFLSLAPASAQHWRSRGVLPGLVLGLALVPTLAAALALGSERLVPTFFRLFGGLCAGLAAITLGLALTRRAVRRG